MNKEWHLKNKMPKNATEEQRIKWHVEHEKNCDCRPMPRNLKEQLNKETKTKST
jgi:hypothetical protein